MTETERGSNEGCRDLRRAPGVCSWQACSPEDNATLRSVQAAVIAAKHRVPPATAAVVAELHFNNPARRS